MNKVPRASFGITMLRDVDFITLAQSATGREALAVFMAITLLARERLQEGRAERDGEWGLRLTERLETLGVLCGIAPKVIRDGIETIATVCRSNESRPWASIVNERIIIRSFFKFNTSEGWGGKRNNAGRKTDSSGNQDDSNLTNQDEIKSNQLENTLVLSPVLVPNPVLVPALAPSLGKAPASENAPIGLEDAWSQQPPEPKEVRDAIDNAWADFDTFMDALPRWRNRGPKRPMGVRQWLEAQTPAQRQAAIKFARDFANYARSVPSSQLDAIPGPSRLLADGWDVEAIQAASKPMAANKAAPTETSLLGNIQAPVRPSPIEPPWVAWWDTLTKQQRLDALAHAWTNYEAGCKRFQTIATASGKALWLDGKYGDGKFAASAHGKATSHDV